MFDRYFREKAWLVLASVLVAASVSGCTQATAPAGSGAGSGQTASSSVTAGSDSSSSGSSSADSQTVDGTVVPQDSSGADSSGSAASSSQSAGEDAQIGDADATGMYDVGNQNGDYDPSADVQGSVYDADAESDAGTEPFSGTFTKPDGSESVTITLENDTSMDFAFSTSQISGSADVASTDAVYYGDDGYTISFSVSGDTLTVTVGGEDGSESPLNGAYTRQS